jgi:predicted ABC-type transport system involved in lysophospholipase L1 biosynthesis ATPase subunit
VPPPLLNAEALVRRFQRPDGQGEHLVLRGASVTLNEGEAVAIVGPSGSGKTTLIHLLAGLDRPDEGSVHIAGQVISSLDEDGRAGLRSRHIGLVLQQDQLLPQCTALHNVLIPTLARPSGDPETLRARALDLLNAVGLSEVISHRPAQLSAGQRQRVAVARALIQRPTLILADEPTGALDRETSDGLLEVFERLRRDHATGLIIVTHDASVVARMDRTLSLVDGALESTSS